jgi:alpha-L-fucosidase
MINLRLLGVSLFILPAWLFAQTPPTDSARTAWFNEARYGLFIHWGPSSVLAGSYQGQRIDRGQPPESNGLGEWIMYNAKIPVADYAAMAARFNPVKFDAEAWVLLAKEAGMKYIVITTKHHDGFAMFKSAASSFNIVDATPFGRDPLKELAAACARHGIRLGFYYSQAQDWHHAGGSAKYGATYMTPDRPPNAGHWDRAQDGDFDEYLARVSIPQVRELLTNYGPISTFWWDSPHGMTPERAAKLAELLKLQPHLITNNRLLNPRQRNPFSGDTETPEQFIPATGFKDRLFEVCMTMNGTWGYKAHDQNWKPAADITRKLIDIASKGGNFLLNVGPDAEGVVPAPSVERLRESGRWVRANGEAIYGTTASRFRLLPWGRSTTKGNNLYLHVFDWPQDGSLVVPGVKTPLERASLLVSGGQLSAAQDAAGLTLKVGDRAPDEVATVIKLEFGVTPLVDQPLPGPNAAGAIELPAMFASVINAYEDNARLVGRGAEARIEDWRHAKTTLRWEFMVPAPGTYAVEAEIAVSAGASVGVSCGQTESAWKLPPTGGLNNYSRMPIGNVDIGKGGDQVITLISQGEDWDEVRLRGIRLVPMR